MFKNNTGRTDGPTDGRTDTTSYRDAKSLLKKVLEIDDCLPVTRHVGYNSTSYLDVFLSRFYLAACVHVLCLSDESLEVSRDFTNVTHVQSENVSLDINQYFDHIFYYLRFDFSFNEIGTLGKPIALSYDYDQDYRYTRYLLFNVLICSMAVMAALAMAMRALSAYSSDEYNTRATHFRNICRAYSIPAPLAAALEQFHYHAVLTMNSIYTPDATLLSVMPANLKTPEHLKADKMNLDPITMKLPELQRYSFEVGGHCGPE